ncbi:uncharacterized protein BXZ73DRAFT_98578 [Epithele typhae]|uniref:uncharacterized protein n=1 Tax=Epithele typhae TaxID=378194 RepID=UPI0020088DF5|nr:uncharacterized protein BXZ73DRAFT_98578 [Epithele typhae]KAH9940747.1 hypothetical protein BXZ73DRAFT_98578 [Epithele typhae]
MSVLEDEPEPVRKHKSRKSEARVLRGRRSVHALGYGRERQTNWCGAQAEKATKGRKRKEPAKELSKDEEAIKRLKVCFALWSLVAGLALTARIVVCRGVRVRKVWSKELKGLDKPSEQIRHLRKMLMDLGMKGG